MITHRRVRPKRDTVWHEGTLRSTYTTNDRGGPKSEARTLIEDSGWTYVQVGEAAGTDPEWWAIRGKKSRAIKPGVKRPELHFAQFTAPISSTTFNGTCTSIVTTHFTDNSVFRRNFWFT